MLDYYFDWNHVLVKCLQQGDENNLCGYYVCEFIRQTTYATGRDLEALHIRQPSILSYYHLLSLLSFINIYWPLFFILDRTAAGRSSTKGSRTSNSRGNCGILRCRGPRSEGRILSKGWNARVSVKEMYICMKLVCTCNVRNMFHQARRMRCV